MIHKLKDSITATNKSVIDLYKKITSGNLVLRPTFQRKLVWRKSHKFKFIQTILDNFPFPEIYIAQGDIDVKTMCETELVVDGQQRLSTIRDYIDGIGDFENQKSVKAFNKLTSEEQKTFLSYKVIVRELGSLEDDVINDIFLRINSTEFSLNASEKMNASYHENQFMIFCKKLLISNDETPLVDDETPVVDDETPVVDDEAFDKTKYISNFFENKSVFTDNDIRRMLDLQYIMILIISLEMGYFNRTNEIKNYLEKYNEEYPNANSKLNELYIILQFINNLHLKENSYWFNKANLFTLLIELSKKDDLNTIDSVKLLSILNNLENEYSINKITTEGFEKYINLAKEAVNDKTSRIDRGTFISKVLVECTK